jgi:predicted dithiol-disulfide oxidoreductase (DUF899 family)
MKENLSARRRAINMGELRYHNASKEDRTAHIALLKEEQELIDKVKALAEQRRKLPPGGQLKEDYAFQWASDGKVRERAKILRAVCR